jgi:ribosome-associated toxin RatA of RatAB toxin-antitoxin module
MPFVEVDEVMPAPVEKIWDLINDVESHPHLMEHVRSVEVLERSSTHRRTAWEIELKGCVVRWVEHEDIDAERYRIDYHQIEGDMGQFEGCWQLERLSDESSRATLTVSFDVGLPSLGEMIDPIAERAIRDNSLSMLHSLAAHAAVEAGKR